MKVLLAMALVASAGLASISPAGAAPGNDNFANARTISGSNGRATGTTVGATREAGEPQPAFNTLAISTWFRWVAPTTGIVSFDTIGSTVPGQPGEALDTALGIYTGSAVNALTRVDDNDDISTAVTPEKWTSRAYERVTAGTTYYIDLAGQDPTDQGPTVLNWKYISGPTNDDFANARVLTGDSAIVTSSTVGATDEGGEPNHDGENNDSSIWFQWTATYTGTARFDTLGTKFDTILGVYTGSAVNGLSYVTSNDDGPSGLASRAVISAVQGTTYRIAVDGFADENGAVRFSLNTPFDDVPFDHNFYEEIDGVFDRGIAGGFVDNTYRPDGEVTRQAMAAFLYRLAGANFPEPGTATFNDVPRSHPFFQEIEWLVAEGIADGYPGDLYRPDRSITREAMAAFLYRLAGEPAGPFPDPGFVDVPPGANFRNEISWMVYEEIASGFPGNEFRPGAPVTRQAMAAFLLRFDDNVTL